MNTKNLVEQFLEKANNETDNRTEIYQKWSETYEELNAQLTTEQQRLLEKLYGCYNDLAVAENENDFNKGLYYGIYLMTKISPNLGDDMINIIKTAE